jgi:hypothetical protein
MSVPILKNNLFFCITQMVSDLVARTKNLFSIVTKNILFSSDVSSRLFASAMVDSQSILLEAARSVMSPTAAGRYHEPLKSALVRFGMTLSTYHSTYFAIDNRSLSHE